MRLGEPEPSVELLLAPGGSLLRHPGDRPQGRAEQQEDGDADQAERHGRERERPDQRGALGLLVGRERDPGDERSLAPARDHDRRRVEADIRRTDVLEAARTSGKGGGGGIRCCAAARPLDQALAAEDPDLAVPDRIVTRLEGVQPAVAELEQAELGAGPGAQQRVRVPRGRVRE